MPTTQHQLQYLIVAHWGLFGSNSSTQPNYRPQNPWQCLEHYMEGTRGDSTEFFDAHHATRQRIDRGGSVWRIILREVPTPTGLGIDEFANLLIAHLVATFDPMAGDQIFVSYASPDCFGQLEWTP